MTGCRFGQPLPPKNFIRIQMYATMRLAPDGVVSRIAPAWGHCHVNLPLAS